MWPSKLGFFRGYEKSSTMPYELSAAVMVANAAQAKQETTNVYFSVNKVITTVLS